MSQQANKVQKRRRREAHDKRRKARARVKTTKPAAKSA
jgi:hypothetical protein